MVSKLSFGVGLVLPSIVYSHELNDSIENVLSVRATLLHNFGVPVWVHVTIFIEKGFDFVQINVRKPLLTPKHTNYTLIEFVEATQGPLPPGVPNIAVQPSMVNLKQFRTEIMEINEKKKLNKTECHLCDRDCGFLKMSITLILLCLLLF